MLALRAEENPLRTPGDGASRLMRSRERSAVEDAEGWVMATTILRANVRRWQLHWHQEPPWRVPQFSACTLLATHAYGLTFRRCSGEVFRRHAERAHHKQAVDVLTMLQVFGEQIATSDSLCAGDDERIPPRQLVACFDVPRTLENWRGVSTGDQVNSARTSRCASAGASPGCSLRVVVA